MAEAKAARARLSISNLLNPIDERAEQLTATLLPPAEAVPPGPVVPTTPKRSRAIELSRTDRVRILALREIAGLSYEEILKKTNYTWAQIQRACTGPVTSQKKKKRKGIISTPERRQLKAWLEQDRHRYTPLYQLPWKVPASLSRYGETALTRAVYDMGWISAIRPRRIQRDEQNKADRVSWCRRMKEVRPLPQDWTTFCFSDKTWAMNDPTWKKRVLMDKNDNKDKYALKKRKPKGWMFWACFAGGKKGPCFFWEKKYGGINA